MNDWIRHEAYPDSLLQAEDRANRDRAPMLVLGVLLEDPTGGDPIPAIAVRSETEREELASPSDVLLGTMRPGGYYNSRV